MDGPARAGRRDLVNHEGDRTMRGEPTEHSGGRSLAAVDRGAAGRHGDAGGHAEASRGPGGGLDIRERAARGHGGDA